jgi:hypothetical protein
MSPGAVRGRTRVLTEPACAPGRQDAVSHSAGGGLSVLCPRQTRSFPSGSQMVPRLFEKWLGRRDLNPRPLDPQPRTRCLARSEGVERGASHLHIRAYLNRVISRFDSSDFREQPEILNVAGSAARAFIAKM